MWNDLFLRYILNFLIFVFKIFSLSLMFIDLLWFVVNCIKKIRIFHCYSTLAKRCGNFEQDTGDAMILGLIEEVFLICFIQSIVMTYTWVNTYVDLCQEIPFHVYRSNTRCFFLIWKDIWYKWYGDSFSWRIWNNLAYRYE